MVEIYAADIYRQLPIIPANLAKAHGQLSLIDRCLYYWVAREYYSGEGAVVDAGALIGCTACILADGLKNNRKATLRGRPIKSYDLFRDRIDGASANLIRGYYGEIRNPGDQFYDFENKFRANTSPYSDLIEVFKGDIKGFGWPSREPIEVLSIDVAKTPELMWFIAANFFPCLTPGKSLILHQDFLYPNQPFLFVAMELLSDFVERVFDVPTTTTSVFALKRPITKQDVLDRFGSQGSDWFNLQSLKYIEQSASKAFTPYGRMATLAGIPYAYLMLGQRNVAAFAAQQILDSQLISSDAMERIPAVRSLFKELLG